MFLSYFVQVEVLRMFSFNTFWRCWLRGQFHSRCITVVDVLSLKPYGRCQALVFIFKVWYLSYRKESPLFKQRAADGTLYFIIPSSPCEPNLFLTLFLIRDWIQQPWWQTARELMNLALRQQKRTAESSRCRAAWPKITPLRLGSCWFLTDPSLEILNFLHLYCDPECRFPCEQPSAGQLSLWGCVQVLQQHQRELAYAEGSDGCSREWCPNAGSSSQHRVQASAGHLRTSA